MKLYFYVFIVGLVVCLTGCQTVTETQVTAKYYDITELNKEFATKPYTDANGTVISGHGPISESGVTIKGKSGSADFSDNKNFEFLNFSFLGL